ncbi:hypothetical protein ACRYI5_05120 [Furfurilactobacillus sp. WILCCON 0119]|uniref:hypothetical protein n=1 Tax=Furfurilactobacillus entadae TaxID=2922307 RepID=UPI0035E8EE8B
MADQLSTIDQLDEPAQSTALTSFATFYITLWRQNNLELVSQFDHQHGAIEDINHALTLNQFFTPDQARQASITFSKADYIHLIDEIGMRFHATGNPEIPWFAWYDHQFSTMAVS